MKIAMLHVAAGLKEAGLTARILLQVHDELVLECPLHELAETGSLVQNIMESAFTLAVPLKTEARSGPDWGAMMAVDD